jgi:Uma2 family endonuclease
MSTTVTVIRPEDHGRKMALEEFEFAEAAEGSLYELNRGVVTVIDVPKRKHVAQVIAIRKQFSAYEVANPEVIHGVLTGSDCKILVEDLDSERHPDFAIYKTAPPTDVEENDIWSVWIPEIVIEVVSPSSAHRDYEEKPDEYLQFGIREYWIVDADKQQVMILRRSRGKWAERIVRPGELYGTRLLPEFEFDCGTVFAAASA